MRTGLTRGDQRMGMRWTRAQVLRAAGLAVGAGSVSVLGAACGAGGSSPAAGGAAKTPVTLQMLSQVEEAFPELLRLAKERMPHVAVNFSVATGYGFIEKALALGAGGTPADLSWCNARFFSGMAEANLLQDLNATAKREKIDLGGIPKAVLDDATWKGKLACLPGDIGQSLIGFNRTLFEKAGQPDPATLWREKKWNWDSFTAAAAAMSRPGANPGEEQYGYLISTWEGDYLTFVRTLSGEVVNKERTKFTLDDGAGAAALARWAELVNRYKASPMPGKGPPGGFNSGRVAMFSTHPGVIIGTRKAASEGGWGWDLVPHPAPAGRRPAPVLFTNGFNLWKGKQEAAATELMKFWVTPELILEWGARTGRAPARAPLTGEFAKRLDMPAQDPKSYVAAAQEVNNDLRGMPFTPNYQEWYKVLVDDVLLPVLSSEKSAQDATRASAAAINAILARQ